MKKLTIKHVKKKTTILTQGTYECLSDDYKNNSTKLKFRCEKNHIFEMTWGNFQHGFRCRFCFGRIKKTIQEVSEYANDRGYKCLSKDYVNSNTKLKWQCPDGHSFYMSWDNFSHGQNCPKCCYRKDINTQEVRKLEYAPTEIACNYCGKKKKASNQNKCGYRKGQRKFYCDGKCRSLESKTVCIVDGCDKIACGKKYCIKHYKQMIRYGRILKRTRFDPNEFIEDGDICRIFLYNKNGEKQAEAVIDIEDMERCKTMKWRLSDDRYVCGGNKNIYLHNFILNRKVNMKNITDHWDHDKLNNRKYNLRPCNKSQNGANMIKKRTDTTSLFKGVYWEKRRKRWNARITKNSKSIYLGSFIDETDAAIAYNDASKIYFGEFANLNRI